MAVVWGVQMFSAQQKDTCVDTIEDGQGQHWGAVWTSFGFYSYAPGGMFKNSIGKGGGSKGKAQRLEGDTSHLGPQF